MTMLVLFTDFGLHGPYIGQVKAVLQQEAPGVPVIDLVADAPRFDPMASAYLLAALAPAFPPGCVFVAVVDPGVGGDRAGLVLDADGRRFVGPDNGLLSIAARRAERATAWRIAWVPDRLSASFHGRDVFAPVAAGLARGEPPPGDRVDPPQTSWPDDLARIIYIDHFGNAMTGLRAELLEPASALRVAQHRFIRARTFSDVAPAAAFWYENANGLAEIAVNQGRADQLPGLGLGQAVAIEGGDA